MKDDEILKQYLLGALEEEQADDVERRLLVESDLFELAEAVEGDLLAAAARGELSPAERGRVLRRLAASPEGRARLALIRGLTLFDREPAEVVVFRLLSRPGARAAAMAACLVLMAGVAWLTSITMQPDERTGAKIQAALPPEPAPTSPSPAPAVPPVDQIAEQSPAPAPPVSPESRARPEPATWVIQLALSTMRGPGEESKPLAIPRGTQRVEIRLPLIPDEPSTSFAAVLRNALTGEEVRREERLAAREVDGQKMVILSVPSADLAPGTYEVEVRGIENGEEDLLGKPTFEVASN